MDTPSLPPGYIGPAIPTYNLKSGETLQWNCTVQAGEGDSLIWMLDEMVIPSSLDINTQQVCKIMFIIRLNIVMSLFTIFV